MTPTSAAISALMRDLPLRAASFIVTLYGDVVVGRGEALWIGNLIEVCAQVGISESLVRTAVSRQVAAGRLMGDRVGRRSYYRLAPEARSEFAAVADLIHRPSPPPKGWLILHAPAMAEDQVRAFCLGRIEPGVFIAPDRGQPLPDAALVLRLPLSGVSDPKALAGFWNLDPLRAGYEGMIARFSGLDPAALSGVEALVARLLLVDAYRHALLRDPLLPRDILAADWPGGAAHDLFHRLYAQLSVAAEPYIGANFKDESGAPLAARADITPASR